MIMITIMLDRLGRFRRCSNFSMAASYFIQSICYNISIYICILYIYIYTIYIYILYIYILYIYIYIVYIYNISVAAQHCCNESYFRDFCIFLLRSEVLQQ